LPKFLIMVVRVLGLAAIVVGLLLWLTGSEYRLTYLQPHIGIGFCVAAAVFVMSVLAMVRGSVVPGVIGILMAVLVPAAGFMQLPLRYRAMGVMQIVHICVALLLIGIAERLYSAIGRAG